MDAPYLIRSSRPCKANSKYFLRQFLPCVCILLTFYQKYVFGRYSKLQMFSQKTREFSQKLRKIFKRPQNSGKSTTRFAGSLNCKVSTAFTKLLAQVGLRIPKMFGEDCHRHFSHSQQSWFLILKLALARRY